MHLGVALLAIGVVGGVASADELTEEEARVQLHGFVSQGALLTSDNNYLAQTERGSLEFTEAALSITKQLDSRLRVGFQLFARDLGAVGNYSAKFDWFNLDYRWRDWLGVRAGRTKVPYGLFNEITDADPAYQVILLPQSIYALSSRDFLLAQTGVEVYGYRRIGALGALEYRAYFGTINIHADDNAELEVIGVDVPWVAGGRVMWETPLEGLRVGGSLLAGEIDLDVVTRGTPVPIRLEIDQTNWLASIEYITGPFAFAAEYGRAQGDTTLVVAGLPMESPTRPELGYVMASYRHDRWLQPTLYYSLRYADHEARDGGAAARSHDAALSFRFDLTPNWLLKLEGHAIRGTAQVDTALNPDGRSNRWYLAAAKTTVYF